MPEPIRVLTAEDHAVVRDGLAAVLRFEPDMSVAGLARNGHEAVALFRGLQPDVLLLDLSMPELDGSEAIVRICAEYPDARILVLTTYDNDESVFRALEKGAKGYLLKDCATAELLAAIRTIQAGGRHVTGRAAARLAERAMAGAALSAREIEVLALIARGKSNKKRSRPCCSSVKAPSRPMF